MNRGAAILFGIGGAIVLRQMLQSAAMPGPPGLQQSMPAIATLDPDVQAKAIELLQEAWSVGIPLVVTEGYRSPETQAALYAQGRTAPGSIVTHAIPGDSWHQYRKAFDVAVFASGRATWPEDDALWRRIGSVGDKLRLEWGGNSKTFVDRPHFAFHPGMTLTEAKAKSV